jgi:hypothetical protein
VVESAAGPVATVAAEVTAWRAIGEPGQPGGP